MKINIHLRNFLMLNFILLSTLPILIVGFFALQSQRLSVEKEILDKNILLAESIAGNLERFLDDSLSFLKQIAFVVKNRNIVSDIGFDEYFLSIVDNYKYFDMIKILNIKGRVSHQVPFDENIQGIDLSLSEFFTVPMKSKKIYWAKTFISPQTSQTTLTVSLPFEEGVIVGHLNLSGLTEIIKNIKIGTSGFASVIDSDGTIIAHPNQKYVQERMNINNPSYEIFDSLMDTKKMFRYRFMGEDKIAFIAVIPQTMWIVEISQTEEDALSSINRGGDIIITGSIITILMAVMIAVISLRYTLRSFVQLTYHSQQLAEGYYSHKVQSTPFVEINHLIDNFKIMSMAVKKREDELNRHKNYLENVVKKRTMALESTNKELESFSYSVSHDLHTPLRGIEGFAKVLYEDYHEKLDDHGKDYINRIVIASKKAISLTNNILRLSRITRKEMNISEIDLSSMVSRILNELKNNEKERNIKFIIKDKIKTKGDKSLVEIAMQNILSNAVKYTSKKETAKIEFGVNSVKGVNVFYVKDNGAGFNMEYKDNLFLPFKRLHGDHEFKGTGIGLFIVSRILLKHKGKFWAESEEGKGCIFYFTLNN